MIDAARNKNSAAWLIAVFMVCCCAGLVMAQSQPPRPAPSKPGQKYQHQAAPEQRKAEPKHQSSEPKPAMIDQGGAKATAIDQQQASGARDSSAPSKRWSIAATVLNLFFTACLVWLMFLQWRAMQEQAKHMKDGLAKTGDAVKAAQESADAATVSANTAKRALETLERADVLIEKVIVSSGSVIGDDTEITVVLKNYGRTRATNVNCSCSLSVGMQCSPVIGPYVVPMTIGAGATYDGVRFEPLGYSLDADTINGINGGHLELQLTVGIAYDNVFDSTKIHRTNCDGSFQPDTGTFRMRQTVVA